MAPVSDVMQTGQSRPVPKATFGSYYRVRPGDTLYSIAWAIKKDYKQVAAWNNIAPPFTIYAGQSLRMFPPSSRVKKQAPVASKPAAASSKRPANASEARLGPVKRWNWPTQSQRVMAAFSPSVGRDGIDIAGKRGDPVYSTANGRVVYSGSGLRGYGKLIIIKHNETYLSAYAHNDNLLVTEGQMIKAGQKIASLGNTGTDRFKLHFEIRRKGKPVNPLNYLPRR
jgi:lipoprotein NlpD